MHVCVGGFVCGCCNVPECMWYVYKYIDHINVYMYISEIQAYSFLANYVLICVSIHVKVHFEFMDLEACVGT